MPASIWPLKVQFLPADAVPKAVAERRWVLPLLLACALSSAAGVAVALRLDTARSVIPQLAMSGELKKSSEREIGEKVEQASRVAIVGGAARGLFLVPLPMAVFWLVTALVALRVDTSTPKMVADLVPSSARALAGHVGPGLDRALRALDFFNLWGVGLMGLGFAAAARLKPWQGLLLGLLLSALFAGAFLVGLSGGPGGAMGGPPR